MNTPKPVNEDSVDVWVTSESGDRLTSRRDLLAPVAKGVLSQTEAEVATAARRDLAGVITVNLHQLRHTLTGIGTSFTESSAFVLAHLNPALRDEVMRQIYGREGADFTLARTHIGACDFCVDGQYSYVQQETDVDLLSFSIDCDRAGFDPQRFAGIKDPAFDLLPMIQAANAIKAEQGDAPLSIVASAWTAPPWMKTINDWYSLPHRDNHYCGTGGELKAEFRQAYADYLVRYVSAYREAGVAIWGLTPVNEPNGNNGQWESLHFTPESQRDFIREQLGPALVTAGHRDVKLMIYDQNRDDLIRWTDTILGDPGASAFVYGTAVHWYDSTVRVFEDEIASVRAKYPAFDLIHTEGCIDDLGKPAPGGVLDPGGYQESGWFNNDAFWWGVNATDWAYTATWAPNVEDHPMYCPVHRYARDILVGINHGLSGWIDWNIALDAQGGPNHVGNFCGAPIMIDTLDQTVYYTPVFYILAQLSRSMRPGDRVLSIEVAAPGLEQDDLHSCATVNEAGRISIQVLNTTQRPMHIAIDLEEDRWELALQPNALHTIQMQTMGR